MSVLSNIGNLSSVDGATITQTFGDLAISVPDVAWICCTIIIITLLLRPVFLLCITEYKKSHTCYKKFEEIYKRLNNGGL